MRFSSCLVRVRVRALGLSSALASGALACNEGTPIDPEANRDAALSSADASIVDARDASNELGEVGPPVGSLRDAALGHAPAQRDAAYPVRDAAWLLPDSSAAFGDADLFGSVPPNPSLPAPGSGDAGEAYRQLAQDVAQKRKLDAAGVLSAYPSKLQRGVTYDANAAQFMDRIQASALALNVAEQEKLQENGFVISTRREFPTFARGLAEIYAEHLPLFVSADALLDTVHRAYDAIFIQLEYRFLIEDLRTLLQGMHTRLASVTGDPSLLSDVDLYLCVARALLDGAAPEPVNGADPAEVQTIVNLALAAQGVGRFELFGVTREEDFSQFLPRAHYEGDPTLQSYFRAQMWLGRVDLRLIENVMGQEVFRRKQYDAMLVMQALIGPAEAQLDRIDGILRALVGDSDSLNPAGAKKLIQDLGGAALASQASDDVVLSAIRKGGYGAQQIASQLVEIGPSDGPKPLSHSYLLLGQRYVVDAHVLSNTVFDRVQDRLMPDPLDAAFAALGNAQALSLDADFTKSLDLPGALAATRTVIDAHQPGFWNASFYNQWLRALRALSPVADPSQVLGLPQLARSEAWGRRVLNTQLASWSQLRHDTLLYAKQSYTGIPICDYPDAYVDPYPEFYRALHDYALSGLRLVERLPFGGPKDRSSVPRYFAALEEATRVLGDMAERELRGEPFSAEQMAFINDAVRIDKEDQICTTIDVPNGWYANLFLDRQEAIQVDLTVSDVHTQPADWGGALVGNVLHVGTGFPRLLVTTFDTCQGPRAYAGVVYAYHEEIAANFERYKDSAWSARFTGANPMRPAEVSWLTPIEAR